MNPILEEGNMTEEQFLKNFEKHLRKYTSQFDASSIIEKLENGDCPIFRCDWSESSTCRGFCTLTTKCPLGTIWHQQSMYYRNHINHILIKEMISIVKKFYKIK